MFSIRIAEITFSLMYMAEEDSVAYSPGHKPINGAALSRGSQYVIFG